MPLTLDKVKKYLRMDVSDTYEDDELNDLILFSKEYIKNTTGLDEIDSEVYRMAQKIIICDRYENRGSADLSIKAQNALSYIITQLSCCYGSDST